MFSNVFTPEQIEAAALCLKTEIPFAIWETLYITVLSTVLACLLGLLFAMLRRGRTGGGEPFPFGPAIAAAGAAMLLFGEPLIRWYTGLF